ncbi:MBL fold metallo-hydrolase [Propylenella binzhouense]|uniref:MBL fold metallo-hydrolase n=1 Tax=Propylenella binzhouense TaxID=2555902 RepID=A0A964T7K3_9HYPH|nr:MBL fold metallo-hydrolase [Propylenella binzhouense]MYZ49274.1 MBL fold metallo-hydrolase [Propylenella binzhouense]
MSLSRTSNSRGAASPEVVGFYEKDTGSIQYVVIDPATKKAAVIDPVWNFDSRSAKTATTSADEIVAYVESRGLDVEWVLDTHPHADHMMASAYLKEKLGAEQGIGEKVLDIAELWSKLYNLPGVFDPRRDFDRLFADGDTFSIGSLEARVMLSPGHTLGSVTYVVGDAAFVHDTLMVPDSGTARADFPGGDAAVLYRSIQAILALPDDTRLFVGHDYGQGGRDPIWEASVAEQKLTNKHLKGGVSEAEYVKVREGRDATLPLPDRMLAALQVNLLGGRLPKPESDGNSYLKIPLNRF